MTIQVVAITIWFKIAGILLGKRTGGGAISAKASILPETIVQANALSEEATTILGAVITYCGRAK
jgi:hypothetical protein